MRICQAHEVMKKRLDNPPADGSRELIKAPYSLTSQDISGIFKTGGCNDEKSRIVKAKDGSSVPGQVLDRCSSYPEGFRLTGDRNLSASFFTNASKNLNIHIEKAGKKKHYVAAIRDSKRRAVARNEFPYEIAPSILTRLEDSVGKNINRNSKLIREFGSELFAAAFKGKILDHYRKQQNVLTRIKLHFKIGEPELLRIPWEFMFDGENFLSAKPSMTITRVLGRRSAKTRPEIAGRLKMLAITPSPLDLPDFYRPHVEKERMIILQAVARAYVSDRIEVDFVERASLGNIHDALHRKEYHILHFTSHGIYSQKESSGYLLLEDEYGNTSRTEIKKIADLLAGHTSIRLMVFSGCQTALAVGHRVLGELPLPLLRKGIPAVITMQYSVSDDSAMDLVKQFYNGISEGLPIDLALAYARRALLSNGKEGPVDFATPILYSDNPDCLLDGKFYSN